MKGKGRGFYNTSIIELTTAYITEGNKAAYKWFNLNDITATGRYTKVEFYWRNDILFVLIVCLKL